MTEKFKKTNRQYVLSDSSVNEYGFRLLTSGYQMDAFQKNPIGYYMHRREDGILLKWEDVHVDNDQVVGTPIINLSNTRGAQTLDEVENGFLNAASVGHIVVLEYSTDQEQMLPGQTGPTITKWYNKECSLVDIPGNSNALTRLYDAQENELNLVDMTPVQPIIKTFQNTIVSQLCSVLAVDEDTLQQIKADDQRLVCEVQGLAERAKALAAENTALLENKGSLLQEIAGLNATRIQQEVSLALDRALEDKKITVALRDRLALDYASNPDGLKLLLTAMPAYRSISELLRSKQADDTSAQWEWDDYEHNDPSGNRLRELRANDPGKYRELFEKKFAA
jgi:hypothetical protein